MDSRDPQLGQTLEEYFHGAFGIKPNAFVGLPLVDARAMAADRGALIRVLSEDGRDCGAITLDKLRRRVNVEVEQGTIVRVDGVY